MYVYSVYSFILGVLLQVGNEDTIKQYTFCTLLESKTEAKGRSNCQKRGYTRGAKKQDRGLSGARTRCFPVPFFMNTLSGTARVFTPDVGTQKPVLRSSTV